MYHPENPTWAPRRARPQQPHAKASKERPAIVNNIFRCYGRPCPLLSVTSSSRMWVYLLLFLHPSHSHALAPHSPTSSPASPIFYVLFSEHIECQITINTCSRADQWSVRARQRESRPHQLALPVDHLKHRYNIKLTQTLEKQGSYLNQKSQTLSHNDN